MRAIREGSIPVEVAYGRIVELVKRTQKTVFGDRAQTAWCLAAAALMMPTGPVR